ncbi:MAG TPA: SpoIID/LytB domain-containing protein [Solirubrobacteraceae bacterium]|nr:SpoIID/LytB domain-containing protein [Solirubrobacteraceae bacterium]
MRGTHLTAARTSARAAPRAGTRPTLRTSVLAALALSVVSAAAAPSANAAEQLVIHGAGFGHGVGMSQYGAFGFAKAGANHGAILAHYYTGTQLTASDPSTVVRVLLKTSGRIVFTKATGVVGGRRLDPAQRYVATRALNGVLALSGSSGRPLGTYPSLLAISGSTGGIRVYGRSGNAAVDGRYRGNLEIRASPLGGVSAIDAVGLEDYVRGVVAGEMPASWPAEALEAQAIAARTYAIATTKAGTGFDQYADTRSQVYNGISGETKATDAAVAATAGQLVTFAGKPIVTYYFSTSGGRTENIENSFLGATPEPYLTAVDDPYDSASPRHRWVRRMSLGTAQARLGALVKGTLLQIKVLQRGASPRVVRAQVVGTGGTSPVSGPTLRRKLGLYDTWAQFTVIDGAKRRGDGDPPTLPPEPATPQPAPASPAVPGAPAAAPSGGTVPVIPPG